MARPSKYDTATQERAVRMYFERLEGGDISKEVAKLRRANEILKTASALFAQAELDRKLR